jgi:subtilisin family serine protease
LYPDSAGVGIDAYVIDTGIRTSHVQFGGRAFFGANFVDSVNSDGNGHGTHVAGTIGGSTFGVAKRVSLIAVKVLNSQGSGSTSGVIAGINWAVNRMKSKRSSKIASVANLSLGGGISSALDNAVAAATAAGLVMVVAAGNEAVNACNTSPARAPTAITVAASTSSDSWASFSNWGICVDIISPGVSIRSSWSTSNTATNTISGTSMAAPHVAGVVALALADRVFTTTQQVTSFIKSYATNGKITGSLRGTPNSLIYNRFVQ